MDKKIIASEVIDKLGGTSAVARLCGITRASVHEWRKNGIPKGWSAFLNEKHPEVFEKDK